MSSLPKFLWSSWSPNSLLCSHSKPATVADFLLIFTSMLRTLIAGVRKHNYINVSSFSCCWSKICDKINLRIKVFWFTLKTSSIMEQRQMLETPLLITSQADRWTLCSGYLLLFTQCRIPALGMMKPTLWVALPRHLAPSCYSPEIWSETCLGDCWSRQVDSQC